MGTISFQNIVSYREISFSLYFIAKVCTAWTSAPIKVLAKFSNCVSEPGRKKHASRLHGKPGHKFYIWYNKGQLITLYYQSYFNDAIFPDERPSSPNKAWAKNIRTISILCTISIQQHGRIYILLINFLFTKYINSYSRIK